MYTDQIISKLLENVKAPEFRREDSADDFCYDPDHEAVLRWLVQRIGMSFTLRKARRPDGHRSGNVHFYGESYIYGLILGFGKDFGRPDHFDRRGLFINDNNLARLRSEIGCRPEPGVGWIIYFSSSTGDVLHTTLNRIVLPGAHEAGTMTPIGGDNSAGIFVKRDVFWHVGNYIHVPISTDFKY